MPENERFHPLHTGMPLPEKFTYPFCYEPHPLCIKAATELQKLIMSGECWQDAMRQESLRKETDDGKMFGVLIVEKDGRTGYLAAYSGQIGGRNDWPFFVPAVFDMLNPDGYFKVREKEITGINRTVNTLLDSEERKAAVKALELERQKAADSIAAYKARIREAKAERDAERKSIGSMQPEENSAERCALEERLLNESRFMKAELSRMRKRHAGLIAARADELKIIDERIEELRHHRRQMSDDLQNWLFSQFRMLNARGKCRNLCDIFADTVSLVPPSGAGECCAPKLLQYAYTHGMRPVCMAEFWWGASPKTEIRHHLHYYPACSGKCKPILSHMLQGLDVDTDPQASDSITGKRTRLETVYDDKWLCIVCKPAGMLTVPGRNDRTSVEDIMRERFPDAGGPMIVHRLDMDTSGLLVVAKTKDVHKMLQEQFETRSVRKRYIAMVDTGGKTVLTPNAKGTIRLPMRADPLDRPRQVVDIEKGKTAVTDYHILAVDGRTARVALYPHTGRTHQLRVHCAHASGLGAPIAGDALYGRKGERLFLHAERIELTHPATGERMVFERKPEF